jgi:hypothetical protein
MITLENGGYRILKNIAYSNSKIPISQNERKQTNPKENLDPPIPSGFTAPKLSLRVNLHGSVLKQSLNRMEKANKW